MSAAILQGVPATTLDTDLWVDVPERQYARVLAVATRDGATVLARTVVALADDTLVNFLFRVDGLGTFEEESRTAERLEWLGGETLVLPLSRIITSKRHIGREKDIAHLPLLERVERLRGKRKASRKGAKTKKPDG
jgi:hypothetical protein